MNFLEKLDALMLEEGINKHVLSKESGIPYTTLDSFYKKGYQNAKIPTIQKLCDYFHVSLDYLICDNVNDTQYGKQTQPNIRASIKNSPTPVQTEVEGLAADQRQLLDDYDKLNEDGQSTARDAVHALTFLAKYKKCYSAEFSQEA